MISILFVGQALENKLFRAVDLYQEVKDDLQQAMDALAKLS